MKDSKKEKIWFDIAIVITSCLWVLAACYLGLSQKITQISLIIVVLICGVTIVDFLRQLENKELGQVIREQAATGFLHELVLLNEMERPIRSWDLTGKTAMIIGRQNKNEEVDVDLSDCEYSALINIQHAVLNYSLDSWYIEDLGSQNGIQIKKVEDGKRYQVVQCRPCILSAGDVIYIAKTRLLFT